MKRSEPASTGLPDPASPSGRRPAGGWCAPAGSPWRAAAGPLLAAVVACWLVACATPGGAPSKGGPAGAPAAPALPRGADGPPAGPPPDVLTIPNAEPRVEPIRSGGANKPYEVLGRSYVPLASDEQVVERGLASWYGRKFHGRRTASGETYNMLAMTAAHKTMPIPSYARVRNPENGSEVIVRVNDRGPFSSDRIIDLSYTAAAKLGILNGVKTVEVERITHDEIRAGLGAGGVAAGAQPVSPPPAATPLAAAVSAPVLQQTPVPPAPVLVAAVPPSTVPPSPVALSSPGAQASPLVLAAAAAADGSGSLRPGLEPAPLAADLPPAAQVPGPAPGRSRAYTPAAAGYWLQLGAFGRGDGAYSFQQRVAQELAWLSPLLTVFADGGLHRLQAGPYGTRDQAREVAERVRGALQLAPVIVERR